MPRDTDLRIFVLHIEVATMKQQSSDDSQKGYLRPGAHLPESARVRRPMKAEPPWKDAPILAANAGVRTDARLREFADEIRSGDYSHLRATPRRGFGTSSRGLAECPYYLPKNRFEWWDWWHNNKDSERMPDGPLSILEGADSAQASIEVEFCSTLATVVGTDLGDISRVVGRNLPWDSLADGASPNETAGIEFLIRENRPGSVPVIREIDVDIGGEVSRRRVLVHGVEEGYEPDPALPRPSLFFDFAVAQRAVALEFGFLSDDEGRRIESRRALLIAYDRDGGMVGASNGSITRVSYLRPNFVRNVIGIRDRHGSIRSVELRFGGSDNPIPEPQLVYRIWHEALPPAAVRQGSVEQVWHGPGHPENSDQEVEEKLPFHCDRYNAHAAWIQA